MIRSLTRGALAATVFVVGIVVGALGAYLVVTEVVSTQPEDSPVSSYRADYSDELVRIGATPAG
ncbi:hypothetical protein [Isoptericola sp. NPDC057191]|uniref:hypothetical protein n=1 Tax=Isoptericola sp. NPDC057191 TaxID=3346041 RepID=UPI0036415C38